MAAKLTCRSAGAVRVRCRPSGSDIDAKRLPVPAPARSLWATGPGVDRKRPAQIDRYDRLRTSTSRSNSTQPAGRVATLDGAAS